MISLHPNLAHVAALVFDLDGTLYQGDRPIDRAVETLACVRSLGLGVRFLTNTTSKCRADVAKKLRRLGFDAHDDEVASPTHAAGEFLRAQGGAAHLAVQPAARPDFAGVPIDDERPAYVVLGDLGDALDAPRLDRLFAMLRGGARLVALGRTRYWRADDGLRLDVGPFVAALEYATGEAALVFGKPAPAFFEAVIAGLGSAPDRIAVVGDDIETDVRAAMRVGCRGVLVQTGKFRPADLEHGDAPSLVLPSVASLVALR